MAVPYGKTHKPEGFSSWKNTEISVLLEIRYEEPKETLWLSIDAEFLLHKGS